MSCAEKVLEVCVFDSVMYDGAAMQQALHEGTCSLGCILVVAKLNREVCYSDETCSSAYMICKFYRRLGGCSPKRCFLVQVVVEVARPCGPKQP